MGINSKDKGKITLYYHSRTLNGEQTITYIKASKIRLHTVDISKANLTGTQWSDLANGLGETISDLIDMEHPDFVKKFGDHPPKMLQHDWLKILEHEPQLLKYPIIFNDADCNWIKSRTDFKRYLKPDST